MRYLLSIVLTFISGQLLAQYYYLSGTESFKILNTTDSNSRHAVWLDLSQSKQANVYLKNGKKLMRTFPAGVQNPFYAVSNGKIWYRPNMKPSLADTVVCLIVLDKITIDLPDDLAAVDTFELLLYEVNALEFEYEKSEKVSLLLQNDVDYTCTQLISLVACLHYPQSKANILAKHKAKFQSDCFSEIADTLPKELQKLLLNNE